MKYNDLIQTAKNGDTAPLAERCIHHIRAVLKHKVPYQDIDDTTQEVLQRMLCKLDQLDDHDRFTGWLNQLIGSCAADYWRQRFRYESRVESLPEGPIVDNSESPETSAIHKEQQEMLQEALHDLPPYKYEAMELFYIQHLSTKEISEKMDRNPNTVRRWLHEARESLKSLNQEDS